MNSKHFCLSLLLLVLLHTHLCQALSVSFGEGDYSIREDQGCLQVIVVARGEFEGNVTVQVVPMTVSQFQSEGLSPTPEIQNALHLDPAEADDFNDDVLTCLFEGGSAPSVENYLQIDIVNDTISEYEEVFLLVLKVVNATEGVDIEVGRNVSAIKIRRDRDASYTKIGFSNSTLNVGEDAGMLNDTVFIEISGVSEHTLYVHLSIQLESDDIRLPETELTIPSGVMRIPVPLEVIDDNILELFYETTMITIEQSPAQRALSCIGDIATLLITIIDNDRAHFKFEMTSAQSGNSSRQLFEGEAAEVCVQLMEPEELVAGVTMQVQLSEASEELLTVNGLPINGYYFHSDDLKFCFNVTANENEVINEPKTARIKMVPRFLIYGAMERHRFDVDDLHIVILDNDGVPLPPRDLQLNLTNVGQNLLVTWTSESTKLRPVSQYRISVKSIDTDSNNNEQSRVQRQSDVELQAFVTTDTRLLLKQVESGKTYTIQVCAENDFGQACAVPKELTVKGKPRTIFPEGLEKDESTTSTLPLGYILAIVLLPLILVLVICILIVSVIACSCCRKNSKHYYPSQQEWRMDKQTGAMEGRYQTRSVSSESIDWTTSSASDFSRV